MALIIETGAQVENANSYVDVVDVAAYAEARGVVLTSTEPAHLESLIVRAMDLLETYEPQLKGQRVSATQMLSWPRKDAVINGFPFPDNAIPPQLKRALCQLAVDADTTDLTPNGDGREVIEERVDVLVTKYAERGTSAPQPTLTAFLNFLSPLLDAGGGFTLELERA